MVSVAAAAVKLGSSPNAIGASGSEIDVPLLPGVVEGPIGDDTVNTTASASGISIASANVTDSAVDAPEASDDTTVALLSSQ